MATKRKKGAQNGTTSDEIEAVNRDTKRDSDAMAAEIKAEIAAEKPRGIKRKK